MSSRNSCRARGRVLSAGAGGLFVFVSVTAAMADAYDPPADYYASVSGNPATLRQELHLIISSNYYSPTFPDGAGHVVRDYGDARYALQLTDRDPNDLTNVILVYNGWSVDAPWDGGVTWNREHMWPRSRGIGEVGWDFSDMFNLKPCDPGVNLARSNDPYGTSSGYWDPDQGAPHRGDVSRAMFYMAVRYDGLDPGSCECTNLTLTDFFPSGSKMGDLSEMIAWHNADPPDEQERRRNHLIFSQADNPGYYQGNRNPFVDHPEYVDIIWGEPADNDSTVYFGATPPADGASVTSVSGLRAFLNGSSPTQAVTLNKVGDSTTTYNISTTGQAGCPDQGTHVFDPGPQSADFDVSIGDTTTAGPIAGTVVVDNVAFTSAGTGQGSDDGDDVVNVSGSVVDARVLNATAVDFGDVARGVTAQRASTISTVGTDDAFTRVTLNTGIYTQFDATVTVGADHIFDMDGESIEVPVEATFAALGQQNGSVTLSEPGGALTGEGLAGETVLSTVILYTANVVFCLDPFADTNFDQDVDQADFGNWQVCHSGSDPFEQSWCACYDRDGDGDVDQDDFIAFEACMSGPNVPADPACDD